MWQREPTCSQQLGGPAQDEGRFWGGGFGSAQGSATLPNARPSPEARLLRSCFLSPPAWGVRTDGLTPHFRGPSSPRRCNSRPWGWLTLAGR